MRGFDKLCSNLESENIFIVRYSIEENRDQLRQNKGLWCLINCTGIDTLPVTYIDGKIEKIEEYPTKKEILFWLSEYAAKAD
jgi:hypothetical protein